VSGLIAFIRNNFPVFVLVLTLAFYPLVGIFSVSIGVVNTTPIAIAYRAVYLLLSLLLILTFLPTLSFRRISLAILSLMLFWTVYVVRMYHDLVFEGHTEGYMSKGFFFYLTYGVGGCLLPAIAIGLAAKSIDYKRLANALLMFFIICNVALLVFLIGENGLSTRIFQYRHRVGDLVVSPIALSQYGGALVIMAGSSWLIGQKRSFILPVCMILGTILIVVGSSRGPLFSVVVCVLFILIDHFWLKAKSFAYWLYASAGAAVLMWFITTVIVPNLSTISLLNRVSLTVEKGQGLDARGIQWSAAWNQFIDSPVWGDLLVENAYNFYPHNMILEILVSTGLLGVAALLPATIILFSRFITRRDFEPEKRLYFYLFLFFFGCAMFSLSMITIAHVWILWALVATMPKRNESYAV
jgi:hypothetical protein